MFVINKEPFQFPQSFRLIMFIGLLFICLMLSISTIFSTVAESRTITETLTHTVADAPFVIPETLFDHPKGVTATSESAPVMRTTLPLFLRGVVASTDSKRSLAVIQGPSGQSSYREGEIISGIERGYLQSISTGEVTIRTPQGIQHLFLNEKVADNKTARQEPAKKRTNNVKYLTDYLTMTPVYKEKMLIGYRVNPKTNTDRYQKLGLINDELVLKIDDQSLNDENTAEKIIEQLAHLREVQISTLRDNQVQNIYINLSTIESSLDMESNDGKN